jgi:hypothetical protein
VKNSDATCGSARLGYTFTPILKKDLGRKLGQQQPPGGWLQGQNEADKTQNLKCEKERAPNATLPFSTSTQANNAGDLY